MDLLNDEREEQAFRELLAGYDEPTPIATPQQLAGKVRVRLPDQAPAVAARVAARARAVRRLGFAALLTVVLGLLALGSWSVLVDSSLPLRLLAGSSLGEALLLLALLVKPLLAALASQAPLLIGLLIGLLVVSGIWWRLLRRSPAYAAVRVRP